MFDTAKFSLVSYMELYCCNLPALAFLLRSLPCWLLLQPNALELTEIIQA